ncbi:MAG: hypothetical protein R6U66_08360 [Bacteroidales bacterium]
MKRVFATLCVSIFFMCIFVFNANAIKIPVYGKAGAVISGDEVKLCPGFKLKKCAVIEITWEDLKKQEAGETEVNVVAQVVVFNENEEQTSNLSYPIEKIADEELTRFR